MPFEVAQLDHVRSMPRIASAILILLASSSLLVAREQYFYKLASDSYVRHMFATTIQPVKSVQDIPSYVIKAAREITGDDFRLATPGERYRSSDAGIAEDEKLPFRQLQWVTRSESHIIICYHRGGLGQAVCVLAFTLEPAQWVANPVLVATLPSMSEPYGSLADIRRAFDHGKLQPDRPTFLDF
jgi:hypothetical protein